MGNLLQQTRQGSGIATGPASPRIGLQGAAQIVQVIHQQVHPHLLAQGAAQGVHAQGIHHLAVQAGHRAGLEAHAAVNQRNLGRFGIITKQLQVNIRPARRRTVPDGATQVRAKLRQPLHPLQRQLPQGLQLGWLGLGTEDGDVLLHRPLQLLVVRQSGARRQTELFDRPPLGGAILQPLFDHHAGGRGSDLFFHIVHASIVPGRRAALAAAWICYRFHSCPRILHGGQTRKRPEIKAGGGT